MSVFKEPLKPNKPKREKSTWDFEAPPYDQRSSCFINAGTDYGVGYKTPVGSEKVSHNKPWPTKPMRVFLNEKNQELI